MAGCELSQEQIKAAVDFHGHWCPGLAIGLRAGEYVLKNLGHSRDEGLVSVVETDMCAVDAIQVLTGCTFGKGNLKYNDQGKMAFSFYRRGDNKAVRLFFESTLLTGGDPEFVELNGRWLRSEATQEEIDRLMAMREERSQRIMDAPLEEVFKVKEPTAPMPRTARILDSLVCEECGEGTMETRTRRLEGRTLCQSCFNALEKRQ